MTTRPTDGGVPEPDPHEMGWHFWRSGFVSDAVLRVAPQPEPRAPSKPPTPPCS